MSVRARLLAPARVPAELRNAMFGLLGGHFRDADRAVFDADLAAKDEVLLFETDDRELAGFTTLAYRRFEGTEGPALIVYSGDTIVRREHRATADLHRHWSRHVFAVAEASDLPAWWLLICSGYKTYRFLPVFFREFFPAVDPSANDQRLAELRDAMAGELFGERFDRSAGVVRLPGASALLEGVADVDERRMADRRVAAFVRENPGHAEGDELVCITRLSPQNLTPAGRRAVGEAGRA